MAKKMTAKQKRMRKEAKPVRHGRWILIGEEMTHDGWTHKKYKCTECGFLTVEAINFCQKCGVPMDGGVD